jgi:hypothetical protein
MTEDYEYNTNGYKFHDSAIGKRFVISEDNKSAREYRVLEVTSNWVELHDIQLSDASWVNMNDVIIIKQIEENI